MPSYVRQPESYKSIPENDILQVKGIQLLYSTNICAVDIGPKTRFKLTSKINLIAVAHVQNNVYLARP
jgi:hypothetical protein